MTSPREGSPETDHPLETQQDAQAHAAPNDETAMRQVAPQTVSQGAAQGANQGMNQTGMPDDDPVEGVDNTDAVSGARRALRLARASLAVLRYKGPLALARQAGLWLRGERGYALRDIREMQDLGMDFHEWFLTQRATPADLETQHAESARFTLRPLISFVVPVYNPPPPVLAQTIASALAQTYDHWELCLVDGASTRAGVRETLERAAAQDARVRVTWLDTNHGIAGNSNEALAAAHGEFVTLLDHDDLVEPDLLYRVVEAINTQPDVDIIYYDEDLVSGRRGDKHQRLLLKPDWSPELLLSTPLLTHATIRRQLILDAGSFDPAFDGAQDWDLFLRLSERANRVVRVPRVLYHWRMVDGSAAASNTAKPYVYERQLRALERHLQRLGAADATASWARRFVPRIVWTPQPTHVSIIIPTKDNVAVLRRCLDSIFSRTSYRDYDITLVDTGSVEAATHAYYDDTLRHDPRVTIVPYGEGGFNYSRACNVGARHVATAHEGASLLFLNNDVEVLDADWLDELVRWSSLPQIGIVGGKLLYPHRRIQHAGVFVGASGLAGHLYYGAPEHGFSILGSVDWYRNCSAVTGALHMMRREVYDAVGGYDERYDISYSDVAICIEAIRHGYRVLYDPFVCLLHYESQSRSDRKPSQHDLLRAGEDFGDYIANGDPCYSPHLSYCTSWPRLPMPDEPSRASMYEKLTGRPLPAALPAAGASRDALTDPRGTPDTPDDVVSSLVADDASH
ncbi:MAG TPA: glycosyltransferase [Ktedonobacterales bacterium]|jgi:GT2 family glycosyltransferase